MSDDAAVNKRTRGVLDKQREEMKGLSEDNPGALNVIMLGAMNFGWAFIERLKHHSLVGEKIWIVFKDMHDSNIQSMYDTLKNNEIIVVKERN